MFTEQILKDIQERDANAKPVEYRQLDLINDPSYSAEKAKMILSRCDSLSDRELYDIIKMSYAPLLEDVFMRSNPETYIDLLSNLRFLTMFLQVINSVQITETQRIYICKLAYDYMVQPDEDKDPLVTSTWFTISKTINRDMIYKLLGLGLHEDFASKITLARYSSRKEIVNVKRVNHVILTSNMPDTMTEQMIIWVYEKLFDTLSDVFKGTMFNAYTHSELYEFGPRASEIYSAMSLAVLILLENQSSELIRKILMGFAADYIAFGYPDIRFSIINGISQGDYPRIISVADHLKLHENIIVP